MARKETANTLSNDLARLIDDRQTSDAVIIISNGRDRVYAHRLLLYSRCQRYREIQDFWSDTYSPKNPYTLYENSCSSQVFRSVLRFIYTGEINLIIGSIFDVLQLANELGVVDLQQRCTSFVTEQITPETATQLLAIASRQKESVRASDSGHSIVQYCIRYVEEKAEEVAVTRGFLELPKQVVIRLVSSNKFALEEADVWRYAVAWAKHQVGIEWDMKHWNEEDRTKISAQLAGIVNHIKLMLIDSKVYAEEVEPTGLVPIEMSLERYRFAAIHGRKNDSSDPRLQPRILHRLFRGSELLKKENIQWQTLLNEWCGTVGKQWQLLHRASQDGFSAKTFHRNCDEHQPTFTIILGSNDCLCGGYTDQPWRNVEKQGSYIASSQSFLFTLVNMSGIPPTRFSVVRPQYAIAYNPSNGPMFGGGPDLCLSSNCNINSESHSNFPHSYGSTDIPSATSSLLMGSDTFTVKDYEVFTLKGPHIVLT